MWKKRGIVHKLFLLHILTFAAVFLLQIVFQSLYFEPFYVHTKKKKIKEFVCEIKAKIKNQEQADALNTYIAQISDKNNAVIAVVDRRRKHHYGSNSDIDIPYFVVRTKDNREYKIIMGFDYNDNKGINEGEDLFIEGFFLQGQASVIFPSNIRIGTRNLELGKMLYFSDKKISKLVTIEGKVVSKQTKRKSFHTQNHVLKEEMIRIFDGKEGQPIPNQLYTVPNTQVGTDHFLVVVENVPNTDLFVLAVTSLQSVNEVIGSLSPFYLFLFIFTMIIVIVVALIYSKTLSKPLLNMSLIAKQIANQNFSGKYSVKSNDELGQMGAALNKISINLEQKITELVHINEKLAQDYELQLKLKAQEKELITNISHELKTPLTIINGYIKGIKNGVYRENAGKYYEVILQEVDWMTEMIQEMLDISQLESPTYRLTESTFDLWHVFLKVYDKFKWMVEDKGLKVHWEGDEEVYVRGDLRTIEQVMTNLFMNAIKYTPIHSSININIINNDSAKKYMFKIENENVHIPDEEIERIWDPFYRIEKSRNKEFGGTGLGLTIVKHILNLHRSNYDVRNTEKGVEFYFDLPAVYPEY